MFLPVFKSVKARGHEEKMVLVSLLIKTALSVQCAQLIEMGIA